MKIYFPAVILLIIFSLLFSSASNAQLSERETLQQEDTLCMSAGIDLIQILQPTLCIEAEYKPVYWLGIKTSLGGSHTNAFYSIKNSDFNLVDAIFIKGGINLKIYNHLRKKESWVFGGELIYEIARHTSDVKIPHAYGTFTGSIVNNYSFYGIGFSFTKTIRFIPQLYIDIGPSLHLLTLKSGLLTESFVPGTGSTMRNNPGALLPTTAIGFKMNLRYRFKSFL